MVDYVRLTDGFVKKIPYTDGAQELYRDSSVRGFVVRVGKKTKSFGVYKKIRGRFVSCPVGKFGDISVKEARNKAQQIIFGLKQDKNDPSNMIYGPAPFIELKKTMPKMPLLDKYGCYTETVCLGEIVIKNEYGSPEEHIANMSVSDMKSFVDGSNKRYKKTMIYAVSSLIVVSCLVFFMFWYSYNF